MTIHDYIKNGAEYRSGDRIRTVDLVLLAKGRTLILFVGWDLTDSVGLGDAAWVVEDTPDETPDGWAFDDASIITGFSTLEDRLAWDANRVRVLADLDAYRMKLTNLAVDAPEFDASSILEDVRTWKPFDPSHMLAHAARSREVLVACFYDANGAPQDVLAYDADGRCATLQIAGPAARAQAAILSTFPDPDVPGAKQFLDAWTPYGVPRMVVDLVTADGGIDTIASRAVVRSL